MTDLLDLLDRPIAFQRSFVALGAGVTGALFLSQAVYWSRRTGSDGWFWKTSEEWEEETGLTRREQDTARRSLRELGILQEDKRGIPCKTWYRVDVETCKTRLAESAKLDWRKAPNSVGGNRQTNTETTAETTAETTKPIREPKADRFNPQARLVLLGVTEPVIRDWLTLRKAKKAAVTETVIDGIQREAIKAGIDLEAALRICCERGWQGFKAEWFNNQAGAQGRRHEQRRGNRHDQIADNIARLTGQHRQQEPDDDDPGFIHGTAQRVD